MSREHTIQRVKRATSLEDLARPVPRSRIARPLCGDGHAFESHKHVRLHLRGSVVSCVSVKVDERVAAMLVNRMLAEGMPITVTYPDEISAVRVATDVNNAGTLDRWTEELTSRLAGIEV